MTCTGSHTIVQADLDTGTYANSDCVDDGQGGAAKVCDDETVTAEKNPSLKIVKTATPTTYDSVGDVIAYKIVATNNGNVTLTNVEDTDAKLGTLVCDPVAGSSLAPNATMTCTS